MGGTLDAFFVVNNGSPSLYPLLQHSDLLLEKLWTWTHVRFVGFSDEADREQPLAECVGPLSNEIMAPFVIPKFE
ncbi:hypothetical protein PILCRDRAFT_361318 [Piloderma croceum F 1598]|uniref:Uncharacterized protein n=1 Tax=Piloderma croceum (strain F 1598) TaxID=765440 RepID=A0A0C3FMQ8_PILCF|nr:hypothetical protein PILCRDRAFT_361318 [Piloderma croceum F 1598]